MIGLGSLFHSFFLFSSLFLFSSPGMTGMAWMAWTEAFWVLFFSFSLKHTQPLSFSDKLVAFGADGFRESGWFGLGAGGWEVDTRFSFSFLSWDDDDDDDD